jgi:hypothetical protein
MCWLITLIAVAFGIAGWIIVPNHMKDELAEKDKELQKKDIKIKELESLIPKESDSHIIRP